MVRRPAAVLILLAVAQAYVLLADALPTVAPEDLSIMAARACGAVAIVAWAAVAAPLSDERALLWPVAFGAGVLVAALNVAGVGAGATPVEALLYASVGAILALGLLAPSLVLALPLVVAVLDVVSTLAGGPSQLLANAGTTQPGDPLSLEMPDWGTGLPAGRLGLSDVIVAGLLVVFARRCGLRVAGTAAGVWAAVVAASALNVGLGVGIPTLPFMALAFYLVNVDRLARLAAAARDG